jgi:hypothetical protein
MGRMIMVTVNGRNYSRKLIAVTRYFLYIVGVIVAILGTAYCLVQPIIGSCFVGLAFACFYMVRVYGLALRKGDADADMFVTLVFFLMGLCSPLAIILIIYKKLFSHKLRVATVVLAVIWTIWMSFCWIMNCLPGSSLVQDTYILNTSSHKIHVPSCFYVEKIEQGSRIETVDTLEELHLQGYTDCKNCTPFK